MMMMHVDCVVQGVRYVFAEDGELIVSIEQLLMTSDRVKGHFVCCSTTDYEPRKYGAWIPPLWSKQVSPIKGMQEMQIHTRMNVIVVMAGTRPRKSLVVTMEKYHEKSLKTLLREVEIKPDCQSRIKELVFTQAMQ